MTVYLYSVRSLSLVCVFTYTVVHEDGRAPPRRSGPSQALGEPDSTAQFTGSASALVAASEQAPTRAPPLRSTLVEESGEGRGGLAARGGESGERGACGCRTPRE